MNWIGSQYGDHSLAIVNRHLCSFLQREPQIILRKQVPESEKPSALLTLQEEFIPFPQADVAVVHQWTPDWTRPNSKRWICMQAWEYGSIPSEWYVPMKDRVDEIWVYSSYNKECYVRSGIPEEKIQVVPLGVDDSVFHPDANAMKLELPSFRFLFVGGTIARKGFDILLQAYIEEFRANDDVCLVVKDNGTRSFYRGLTGEKAIREAKSDPRNPRIAYIDESFSDTDLAGLYRACDCLVHPYRGEGFGLPIAEAMACGLPVIVPDKGPSRDLCNEKTALLLPSREVVFSERKAGGWETVDFPWWLSVEKNDLREAIRFAYENRTRLREKGQKASERILASFTWKNCAATVSKRLQQLA